MICLFYSVTPQALSPKTLLYGTEPYFHSPSFILSLRYCVPWRLRQLPAAQYPSWCRNLPRSHLLLWRRHSAIFLFRWVSPAILAARYCCCRSPRPSLRRPRQGRIRFGGGRCYRESREPGQHARLYAVVSERNEDPGVTYVQSVIKLSNNQCRPASLIHILRGEVE